MHLVAQDYLGEGTHGNTSCGASVLMWTDEDRWETSSCSLGAAMQGGSQPTGGRQDVGSVTQDRGQVYR